VLHQQPIQPTITCKGGNQVSFWVHEAFRQLIPWTAATAACHPLPLKHAVLAQAGAAGVFLLPAHVAHLRRLSLQLCPASEGFYTGAVQFMSGLLACILPPPLGSSLLDLSRTLSPAATFAALALWYQLGCSYITPLALLWCREWPQRQLFARQRRLAPAAVALLRQRDWAWLRAADVALLAAVLFAACLAAVAWTDPALL